MSTQNDTKLSNLPKSCFYNAQLLLLNLALPHNQIIGTSQKQKFFVTGQEKNVIFLKKWICGLATKESKKYEPLSLILNCKKMKTESAYLYLVRYY